MTLPKTGIAIVVSMLVIISAVSAYLVIFSGSSVGVRLNVPTSALGSIFSGYNISLITNKSEIFSGTLKSEGYVSASDEVFNATNKYNKLAVTIILMRYSNSSGANKPLSEELSLVKEGPKHSGSYFSIIGIKNYSHYGITVPIYEILDIGVLNLTTVNRSIDSGLPTMPYYQFTSMFVYGDYYGSATVNGYYNSSTFSNASMSIAEYLINRFPNAVND
jgi:hypothetical protein